MFFRKKRVPEDKVSVLFVCMGNICRSPAAEGVFKHFVEQQGASDKFYIDSAGTIDSHAGHTPDERMIEAAKSRAYHLDSSARKVNKSDISEFDLVLAMDFDNLMYLYALAKGEPQHVRLFGSFLDGAKGPAQARSVPDPYNGKQADFDLVLDMIEAALPNLFSYCQQLEKH